MHVNGDMLVSTITTLSWLPLSKSMLVYEGAMTESEYISQYVSILVAAQESILMAPCMRAFFTVAILAHGVGATRSKVRRRLVPQVSRNLMTLRIPETRLKGRLKVKTQLYPTRATSPRALETP